MLVNYTYAALTSDLPAVWPFVQGAMFLAVVLLFPGGLVSLWEWMGTSGRFRRMRVNSPRSPDFATTSVLSHSTKAMPTSSILRHAEALAVTAFTMETLPLRCLAKSLRSRFPKEKRL